MLRSMYSGISGMKSNQTKLDVVANNVANVGTTAFKKSSARFTDALYQSALYASSPGGTADNGLVLGGVSPGQVGIGVKVSGIFKNMVQGAIQPTGRPTDLAIDGDGFFTVSMPGGQVAYTRDGSFSLDLNGNLVTADGYKVVNKITNPDGTIVPPGSDAYDVDTDGDGINDSCAVQIPKEVYYIKDGVQGLNQYEGQTIMKIKDDQGNDKYTLLDGTDITNDINGAIGGNGTFNDILRIKKVVNFNISKEGKVSYLLEDGSRSPQTDTAGQPLESQQQLTISMFQNPEGLEQLAGNLYSVSANSGNAITGAVSGQINQGAIEMSNVDLSEEFTEMIVTQRAFQASSKVITTSDELLQEIMNLKR